MEVSVDTKRGFITACLKGPQTRETFQAAFDALARHPSFDFSLNRLWDVREAGLQELSAEDMLTIQRFMQRRLQDTDTVRAAVLVAKDIDYGIGNMFRLMTDGQVPVNVRIFREPEEAVAWVSGAEEASES